MSFIEQELNLRLQSCKVNNGIYYLLNIIINPVIFQQIIWNYALQIFFRTLRLAFGNKL